MVTQKRLITESRPLCVATALYRWNREDLGGFNMNYFAPSWTDVSELKLCKSCAKSSQKENVTLQPDGKYLVVDSWYDALTKESKEALKDWDKKACVKDKAQFDKNLADAKRTLSGKDRQQVLSWFRQEKVRQNF